MKTNKIALIITGLITTALLAFLFVQNQNKKTLSENQGQIKSEVEIPLHTRDEVLLKNGFSTASPRWGSLYVVEGHPDLGIEGYLSTEWGQKLEKAVVILTRSQLVYDEMIVNPISYCTNCGPLAINLCLVNTKETKNSSVVGLYEIATNKSIKAWTVNPITLKFEEYQDFQGIQCNLDERSD